MTERSDIIGDGTDGFGDLSAGSSDFPGRTTSDPAEAETVSGSFSSPSASSGVDGGATASASESSGEVSSSAAQPPAGESSPDASGGLADRAGGDGELSDAEAVVEGEIDELGAIASERDEYKDLALRAKADFENYRKRADKRVAETRGSAIAGVVRELLPVIDNLDRAVEAAASGSDGDSFVEGVRLVHADLHSVFDRLGLTSIDPAGERFDPNLHEAISQVAVEGTDAGVIVEVAQKGFLMGETVVRPARVVVAS